MEIKFKRIEPEQLEFLDIDYFNSQYNLLYYQIKQLEEEYKKNKIYPSQIKIIQKSESKYIHTSNKGNLYDFKKITVEYEINGDLKKQIFKVDAGVSFDVKQEIADDFNFVLKNKYDNEITTLSYQMRSMQESACKIHKNNEKIGLKNLSTKYANQRIADINKLPYENKIMHAVWNENKSCKKWIIRLLSNNQDKKAIKKLKKYEMPNWAFVEFFNVSETLLTTKNND